MLNIKIKEVKEVRETRREVPSDIKTKEERVLVPDINMILTTSLAALRLQNEERF